ncbi:MAG: hypothetical protein CM1200mP14_10350 [Gammaproteobacteria bacterium]|nr:MAG: hypothetical protein CM1200mP14_10350 [Gammaproteobacteria bacterium]
MTDYAGIDFDATGATVFVGLRDWTAIEANDAESGDSIEDEEISPADVQVWHWDDDQILRSQEYRAEQISRQTFLAAWHVRDDELVILGEDFSEEVEIVADGKWGIVPDYTPYRFQRRFGDGAADWYRVDLQTGERTLLAAEVQFGFEAGGGDSPVLVYGDNRWSAVDLTSMQKTVLAEGQSFTQPLFDHDYPGPHPPWGIGGWDPYRGRRCFFMTSTIFGSLNWMVRPRRVSHVARKMAVFIDSSEWILMSVSGTRMS